jgi:hypothetical protein
VVLNSTLRGGALPPYESVASTDECCAGAAVVWRRTAMLRTCDCGLESVGSDPRAKPSIQMGAWRQAARLNVPLLTMLSNLLSVAARLAVAASHTRFACQWPPAAGRESAGPTRMLTLARLQAQVQVRSESRPPSHRSAHRPAHPKGRGPAVPGPAGRGPRAPGGAQFKPHPVRLRAHLSITSRS